METAPPPTSPQQAAPPPPQAPYPYPPPYAPPYYPPPGKDGVSKVILIVVIAVVAIVLVTVVLAAVLYVMVSGLISGPGPGPQVMGFAISLEGANWSLVVSSVSSGRFPGNTFLTIFDGGGGVLLARQSWSAFTPANWPAHRVAYVDSSPSVQEIAVGDRLLVDRATYPPGSEAQVSTDSALLWAGRLQ